MLLTGKGGKTLPFLKREITPNPEDPGNYKLISLISVLSKIKEKFLLETMLRHTENTEMVGDNQHGFTKLKSSVTNLVVFCDEVRIMMGKGRANAISLSLLYTKYLTHDILAS